MAEENGIDSVSETQNEEPKLDDSSEVELIDLANDDGKVHC